MNRLFTTLLLSVLSFILFAQEDTTVIDSLQPKRVQIVDSMTIATPNGDLSTPQVVTQLTDTLVFELKDNALARNIDSLWMQQLYNNEMFEEVYGSITQQNYEPVDYEELPTEVLKQRLAELNARTPFNVEYNPSLESVIKGYLKNRRKTMANLMAISDYYFPMFEEELDRYNLPLEMKYLAIVGSRRYHMDQTKGFRIILINGVELTIVVLDPSTLPLLIVVDVFDQDGLFCGPADLYLNLLQQIGFVVREVLYTLVRGSLCDHPVQGIECRRSTVAGCLQEWP